MITFHSALQMQIPSHWSEPQLNLLVIEIEENQELINDADGKCLDAKTIITTLSTSAFGFTNNAIIPVVSMSIILTAELDTLDSSVIFTGYPVIGNQNRVQSSGSCLDGLEDLEMTACPWDPRVKGEFFHQTTFSISLSVVKNFIQDMQNLVALDPKALCGLELYNGILMRYVTASSSYLGKQGDAMDFDITYYRSKDPMTPRLYEDVIEEIEQMALFKYGALPHWGKNRNIAFVGSIKKFKKAGEFLRVKGIYDPLGLFSSEWTDQVLGLKNGLIILKEGCALEGLCICFEDIHCAPKKGYYCRPGKVYKHARVCSRSALWMGDMDVCMDMICSNKVRKSAVTPCESEFSVFVLLIRDLLKPNNKVNVLCIMNECTSIVLVQPNRLSIEPPLVGVHSTIDC
ncbi:probable truncated L-gulonolactone oxidase 7, mitochondrial [Tripterygium wilfordii]|uniref:probable truncated L-gulonolactone oxidase 7, mitochondrial n=1 Tax=Tripterygium wilfordii TaxID=458696 RepID=UPI0018F818BF|nr:probable truncated L-gulonolactone oxidase 7, mitochondrial [Tripterygium wilfordii]